MEKEDLQAKKEMEMRFALSDVLRNIINKSENGEIALADFIEEVDFVVKKGKETLIEINNL